MTAPGSAEQRTANREHTPVVACTTHELLRAACGHPIVVGALDGGTVLLRLATPDEVHAAHVAARAELPESCRPPAMTLARAAELVAPVPEARSCVTTPTGHQTPAPGKAPTGYRPAGVRGGGTGGGAPGVGAAAGGPSSRDAWQRNADAIAHNGIAAVLQHRFGHVPLSVRQAAADAALTAAADWCRDLQRRLEQRRDERPDDDAQWVAGELDRLARVVPAEPEPIRRAVARADGQTDPHRERVVTDVARHLTALIGGLSDDDATRAAAAVVDRLGVA